MCIWPRVYKLGTGFVIPNQRAQEHKLINGRLVVISGHERGLDSTCFPLLNCMDFKGVMMHLANGYIFDDYDDEHNGQFYAYIQET